MKAFGMSEEEIKKLLYPTLDYRSLPKNDDISKNVNLSVCAECGGSCCKQCGCNFSPDDFNDISFEGLKKEIQKRGYIPIDYVCEEMICSEIGIYILRARNKGAPIVDPSSSRTQCILLTEKGCKLDYKQRPAGGRLLIPNHKGKCYSQYGIRESVYEWKPHKKILHQLVEFFEKQDFSSL